MGSDRFQIRRASLADLDDVCAVETSSFNEPYPRFLLAELLRDCASTFFVAVDRERVVGYCVASLEADLAHLISMAILPEFRRGGVGKGLLRELMACLLERKVHAMFLEVKVENRAAIALYSSFGAVRVKVVPNYYSDGSSALKMRFTISRGR